ncbi:MAG: hypothetical protein U1E34_00855 [Amaricoccus sp.]
MTSLSEAVAAQREADEAGFRATVELADFIAETIVVGLRGKKNDRLARLLAWQIVHRETGRHYLVRPH